VAEAAGAVEAAAGRTGSHKGMFRTLFLYLLPPEAEAPMFGPTSPEGW
jgi:hypothetical protein